MGITLFPTVAIGRGNISADFSLRFGYASELWFNNGNVGMVLGVNVIAILFVTILTKVMYGSGIQKWPWLMPKGWLVGPAYGSKEISSSQSATAQAHSANDGQAACQIIAG